MSPRLAFAMQTAYTAGKSTLAHFGTVGFDLKADASPVTVADKEAESLIRQALAAAFPHESILGEEEGGTASADQWVIDPIDGTKSFVCGVPLYATLLSYERAGLPVVGVAYFPALDLMVAAERDAGATANGRPIRVSNVDELRRSTLCCGGHKSMEAHQRQQGFQNLARQAMTTRTWGDAYGHCLVAMGRVEAMVDPILAPWDVSAVGLIVEEAGGSCTDFAGSPNPRNQALSSNGILHPLLVETFAS